jgi:hypothetical protein
MSPFCNHRSATASVRIQSRLTQLTKEARRTAYHKQISFQHYDIRNRHSTQRSTADIFRVLEPVVLESELQDRAMIKSRGSSLERSFAIELLVCVIAGIVVAISPPARTTTDQPYVMESVYKVKDGHSEEYLQLLKKHQFKILDREKTLGDVLSYTVYHPQVGASENRPWDYRIVTVYKNPLVPAQANAIEQQLFPDRDTFSVEENHRLALTDAHWDLPLSEVDPRTGTD